MPCWTVQKSEVKFSGLNQELLESALSAIGFWLNSAEYSRMRNAPFTADRFADMTSVVVGLDGKITVNSASKSADLNRLANEVKRAYSAEVVKAAAKKFGWNMTQTAENKFAVKRRF